MSDSFRIHRDAYLTVALFVLSWLALAIVLDPVLGWLHATNGTFPALQRPIDTLITIALASVATGVIRTVAARRSITWRRARVTAMRRPETATPATTSSDAGLAATR